MRPQDIGLPTNQYRVRVNHAFPSETVLSAMFTSHDPAVREESGWRDDPSCQTLERLPTERVFFPKSFRRRRFAHDVRAWAKTNRYRPATYLETLDFLCVHPETCKRGNIFVVLGSFCQKIEAGVFSADQIAVVIFGEKMRQLMLIEEPTQYPFALGTIFLLVSLTP